MADELQRQLEAEKADHKRLLELLQKRPKHCSLCGERWKSRKQKDVCPSCGKEAEAKATVQTRPEPKRRHRKRPKQPELGEGYDQLPEPYLTYYKVAMRFAHKALTGEKDDLLHSIIEGLAKVGNTKASKGEDFTESAMHRTAEHIKDWYWYKHYSYTNGLDCHNCSKAQRAKCRYNWGHSEWAYCDCHRAIQLESLNRPIIDNEGNETELAQLIADDKALDLEEWTDARTFLIGAPIRLKAIAMKVSKGEKLSQPEHCYLYRLRQKQQIALV